MTTTSAYGGTETTASGYTIDDLHKKTTQEATGSFEKIFVRVRDILEDFDPSNTIQSTRYDICHQIARCLCRTHEEKQQ
jgi:hypothetical protein